MNRTVVVIGAGVGGLMAALRLAQAGFGVQVLEARDQPGGLASGVHRAGLSFDAGPYILLDRLGLEWAFEQAGLDLAGAISLQAIDDVYEVQTDDGARVRFYSSLEATAAGFEKQWPGSGRRYQDFVGRMDRIASALLPMQRVPRPNLRSLISTNAWMHAPFLLKSLAAVLDAARLPSPVVEALAIWTHVAGQSKREAPSPMALVPALMHRVGSYYPQGGIRRIPEVLESAATKAGAGFRYGTKVTGIRVQNGKAAGVETDTGEFLGAAAVVSNASALSTYLQLVNVLPQRQAGRLRRLPLQSPGVAAYLAVRGDAPPPYLRFQLGERNQRCRLLIRASAVDPQRTPEGWAPARLLAPMNHAEAEKMGEAGQMAYLDRLLDEAWWRDGFKEVRVLAKRTTAQWGSEYHLYANSMNPVMTAAFMRQGRFAHRSPHLGGLYLAGSSTHPGQWVSFCAVSGILAAQCLIEDKG